jgi:sulfur carrier protein ThiS
LPETVVEIQFKLYASLTTYLPAGSERHRTTASVPEGTSVQAVIDLFKLPPELVHLVFRNGVFVPPAERHSQAVQPGDELAIWPPVAGG